MAIKVQIPAPMRQLADGKTIVEATGATVGDVLQEIGKAHPALLSRIYDNGQLRRFVNIYLDNEDIRYLDGLNTPVGPAAELAIIPAVAGG